MKVESDQGNSNCATVAVPLGSGHPGAPCTLPFVHCFGLIAIKEHNLVGQVTVF